MDTPEFKICTKCGKKKPLNEFAPDKRRKSGRTATCQTCKQAYNQAYYEANKERMAPQYAAYRETHREENTAYQAVYRVEKAEKIAQKLAETRDERLEKKRIYNDTHRAENQAYDAAHKTESKTRHAANYKKKKVTILTRNAQWRKANHVANKAIVHRRRARKQNLPDTWTAEQHAFMLSYWHHTCAVCGNQEGLWWTIAVDHWIALGSPDCPGTVATNMVPLCHGDGGCNNNKWATHPHDWLVFRFGPKQATKIEKAIATYFAIVAERFPEEQAS